MTLTRSGVKLPIETKNTMAQLNGMAVIKRTKDAIYMRIPTDVSTVIEWGCDCPYCKAHPDILPRWDTLAITTEKSKSYDATWTVHMPDPV